MPEIKKDIENEASEYFGMDIRIKGIIVNEEEPEEVQEDVDLVAAAIQLAGQDKVEVISEE